MTDTTSIKGNTEQNGKQMATLYVVDLNMRDYFAAKALPSILAPNPSTGQYAQIDDFQACAVVAYAMADAMIKARSNK